jgi:hypothetical protein
LEPGPFVPAVGSFIRPGVPFAPSFVGVVFASANDDPEQVHPFRLICRLAERPEAGRHSFAAPGDLACRKHGPAAG